MAGMAHADDAGADCDVGDSGGADDEAMTVAMSVMLMAPHSTMAHCYIVRIVCM